MQSRYSLYAIGFGGVLGRGLGHGTMERAARLIGMNLSGSVLIKGGHLTETADDLLYDNGEFIWYRGERIDNPNTHGET